MTGYMPPPNPEVIKGIVEDKVGNLDRETEARAQELRARRAFGKARGPLRTALLVVR